MLINTDKLKSIISAIKAYIKPSDYEQNDSTAKDYIRNRPFYDDRKTVKIFEFDSHHDGETYKITKIPDFDMDRLDELKYTETLYGGAVATEDRDFYWKKSGLRFQDCSNGWGLPDGSYIEVIPYDDSTYGYPLLFYFRDEAAMIEIQPEIDNVVPDKYTPGWYMALWQGCINQTLTGYTTTGELKQIDNKYIPTADRTHWREWLDDSYHEEYDISLQWAPINDSYSAYILGGGHSADDGAHYISFDSQSNCPFVFYDVSSSNSRRFRNVIVRDPTIQYIIIYEKSTGQYVSGTELNWREAKRYTNADSNIPFIGSMYWSDTEQEAQFADCYIVPLFDQFWVSNFNTQESYQVICWYKIGYRYHQLPNEYLPILANKLDISGKCYRNISVNGKGLSKYGVQNLFEAGQKWKIEAVGKASYTCDTQYSDSLGYYIGDLALSSPPIYISGNKSAAKATWVNNNDISFVDITCIKGEVTSGRKYIDPYYIPATLSKATNIVNGEGEDSVKTVGAKLASGASSHAEGSNTTASGHYSHAEGGNTTASGDYSHAEGSGATASGYYSHAEGRSTTASGYYSHAEGYNTKASVDYSHAEGHSTTASGYYSHAEGRSTTASGYYSHAEGYNATAQRRSQHAQGEYNVLDTTGSTTTRGAYAHIVGNGTSTSARSNAHTLDWSGNAWFAGDVYVGSTSGTNKDDGSKKLATEEFVTNAIAKALASLNAN